LPWRNVRINADTTDILGVNNTDPLILSSGNGIDITWDSTNKKIVITNTKPHILDNTDFQVSQLATSNNADYRLLLKRNANDTDETGTVRFASTLQYNPSTNLLKINGQTVINTGNITSANATIGTTLTTIATLGGVEIKAKIENDYSSYLSSWDIEADKASFALT